MWKSRAFLPTPEIFRKFTRLNLWAVAAFLDATGGFWLAPTKMMACNAFVQRRKVYLLLVFKINEQ